MARVISGSLPTIANREPGATNVGDSRRARARLAFR
jgi:hypothetical protein